MLTKSPLFYISLAMIAASVFTVCELTVLHPHSAGWVILPVMTSIAFVMTLLGLDAQSMASDGKKTRQ